MGAAAQNSALIASLLEQAGWCQKLGSPLYATLLRHVANDVESGGVCSEFLQPLAGDPARPVLALRFLAMLHRLALEGKWPELARHYPSCGGEADADGAWTAIQSGLSKHAPDEVPPVVQTNEVGRCCALLPGFLRIAEQTRLPLRLLEIGSSAGLNLRWDQYRYEAGGACSGDPDSPVVFRDFAVGDLALPSMNVQVAERRGCDLHPIKLTPDGMLGMLSFLWPDQLERLRMMKQAFEIARRVPVELDRADAVDWTSQQLAEPRAGVATVLFHSIVMLYLAPEQRLRLESIITDAGQRASAQAPLAWLRMERGEVETDIHLTMWPSGESTRIARAGFHGRSVELLSPGSGGS
jgi:hypothetical protein